MVVLNPSLRAAGRGCAWLVIVSASLFVGLMIATAGTALFPRLAGPGAALLCAGEVVYESRGASYRPGEYIVTRQIHCTRGSGKGAERQEITFKAIGVSFLIYSAVAFVLLAGLALLLRRKSRDLLAAPQLGAGGMAARGGDAAAPDAAYSPADISEILEQVAEAVQRGGPNVAARSTSYDARTGHVVERYGGADDEDGLAPAERLTRLKQLHDQGLITAAEYQTKRAEILSGL